MSNEIFSFPVAKRVESKQWITKIPATEQPPTQTNEPQTRN